MGIWAGRHFKRYQYEKIDKLVKDHWITRSINVEMVVN